MTDFAEIEPNKNRAGKNYSRDHGLSGFVLGYADLFRRLVTFDPAAAKKEFQSWPQGDPIFDRLRIWASAYESVTTPEDFASLMLTVSDEAFWPFRGERDLLLALARRWNHLSASSKAAIEARIMKGPNRHPRTSKKDHIERAAHWQLDRLNWLESQGAVLTLDVGKATAKLRAKAPRWKPEYVSRAADDHDGRTGSVHVDTSWSVLASLPPAQIIAYVEKPLERDFGSFTRQEPFAGLSADAPLKAMGALAWATRHGKFPMGLWSQFFQSERRSKDSDRMVRLIAGRLTQLPNAEFSRIILTASMWFEDAGVRLVATNNATFARLWKKFLDVLKENGEAGRSALVRTGSSVDWTNEATNSPAGNLTEMLFKDPSTDSLKGGSGLPKDWLERVSEVLSLQDDSRRFALVVMGHHLGWLYWVDPTWTESALLTILDAPDDDVDRDALWDGFMWGAGTPDAPLYVRLKPHLLKMALENTARRRRHSEVLAGILLAGWGSTPSDGERYITTEELRDVLVQADRDFLSQLLWQLDRWTNSADTDWTPKLLEFLRTVWPKQKGIRTPEISARLVEIALSQKSNFAEVAREITQLVSRVEDDRIFIAELRDPEETRAYEHPKETLDLLYAILSENPQVWPYGASTALKNLEQKDSSLLRDPKLIELKSRLVEI